MRRPVETPSEMNDAQWSALLDAIESAIATGDHVDLPDDIGRVPDRLVGRAQLILAAHDVEIERLTAERDAVAAELSALHRSRPARSKERERSASTQTLGTLL